MSSYYSEIRAALETRLSGTVGLPPIAWENVKYDPNGSPYIRARLIHGARRPAVRGLNPQMRYQGVFLLTVYVPEGSGPNVGQSIVDTIIERFPTSEDISFTNASSETVVVTVEQSEQMGAYNQSPYYVIPVHVDWYSYA